MKNPLEQFKVLLINYINLSLIEISITNTMIYLFFISFIFFFFAFINLKKIYLIPTN